jgi:hypothetical protein
MILQARVPLDRVAKINEHRIRSPYGPEFRFLTSGIYELHQKGRQIFASIMPFDCSFF